MSRSTRKLMHALAGRLGVAWHTLDTPTVQAMTCLGWTAAKARSKPAKAVLTYTSAAPVPPADPNEAPRAIRVKFMPPEVTRA